MSIMMDRFVIGVLLVMLMMVGDHAGAPRLSEGEDREVQRSAGSREGKHGAGATRRSGRDLRIR